MRCEGFFRGKCFAEGWGGMWRGRWKLTLLVKNTNKGVENTNKGVGHYNTTTSAPLGLVM